MDPTLTLTHKQERRARCRAQRAAIPLPDRGRAARAAADHLLDGLARREARCVALYAAFRDELDTGPALDALWARGLRVALPRVIPGGVLHFHGVAGRHELAPGALGIFEPAPDAPRLELNAIDAFVVPGLAFDARGGRLGWGRGHYDRAIALRPGPCWIGYAYASQCREPVPVLPHDRAMHAIVTEAGWLDIPCSGDSP